MKYLNTILIIGIMVYLGFFNRHSLGGVRGGARTGFYLMAGESMGIGTSTITADIEVVSHSTSTLRLAKDLTATSTGGCLILTDYDGGGDTYVISLNGILTSSSSNICN